MMHLIFLIFGIYLLPYWHGTSNLGFRGVGYVSADNPTSIVQPYDGPDPGYIIAECTSGLSNRLRVLAAYMYIGEFKFDGAHTVFIWDKNDACPGHFLSIFEPINGVIFATNSSRYVLDKHAKIVYENSYAVFNWIMQMNQIPKNKFGFPTWSEIEYRMFSKYYPTREVMLKASAFVAEHSICNASAMHLRTTDLDRQLGKGKRVNINSYFAFVESRPVGEKVFLLTDSPVTQRIFLERFGPERILVYSLIPDAQDQLPLFVADTRARSVEMDVAALAPYSDIGGKEQAADATVRLNDSTHESAAIAESSTAGSVSAASRDGSADVNIGEHGSPGLGPRGGMGAGIGGKGRRGVHYAQQQGRLRLRHGHGHGHGHGVQHPLGLGGALLRRNMTAQPLAEEHRFTSLEHTLIDVIIAAHAQTFKPSQFSSLSDLVRMFSRIGKQERGWCS